jgi:hypothetical protein
MINFLEKTRQSFEFLIGEKPSMDLDPQPKQKGLFGSCKFAIVRSAQLDLPTASQVRFHEHCIEGCTDFS